ncbi:MAG: PAS domain-containing protein, partial [Proteobacteria bacterium]|nr:PAS domain-containing protein [Pseudomonadota bacterium]
MGKIAAKGTPHQLPVSLTFNFEHFLSLPCHVYWKDTQGVYINYNDYGAKRLGFYRGLEVNGSSDYEIFPRFIATGFIKNDQEVIVEKKQIFFQEDGVLKDNLKVIFCSYKIPLFNDNDSVIGVLGFSFTRAPKSRCFPLQIEQSLNYHPSIKHPNKTLSRMEDACMRHLCHGLTVKQIARQLKLSPKTV